KRGARALRGQQVTNHSIIETRTVGSTAVSAIGFGCMSLSNVYGASDDRAGVELIREAIDRGVTLLDTSDMYGFGHNETLVGQAIVGRRAQVFVATKFGNLGGRGGKTADGRPEYVISACEASLKRLGIEAIDLYYQHRVDPTVPIEDTVGAMARLVEAGKVRFLGLSEARPQTIRRANGVHRIAAIQNEYSLLYRVEAEDTLRTTRELGIAFVAYAPLGRGLLTAHVEQTASLAETDTRRRHPRFAADNLAHNLDLVHRIEAIAQRKSCTPGQLALAWLLAQGPDVIPIPGPKRKEQRMEDLGAVGGGLSEGDVGEMSAAIPPGSAAGTRYPEGQMKGVFL